MALTETGLYGLIIGIALAVAIVVPIAVRTAVMHYSLPNKGRKDDEESDDDECDSGTMRMPDTKQHRATPGCPVIFTEAHDFRGIHSCFGIGRYNTVDIRDGRDGFFSGIVSYEIRPGYTLRMYSEPDFHGELILQKRGGDTGKKETTKRRKSALPLPASMIVGLDTTTRIGGSTLRKDTI